MLVINLLREGLIGNLVLFQSRYTLGELPVRKEQHFKRERFIIGFFIFILAFRMARGLICIVTSIVNKDFFIKYIYDPIEVEGHWYIIEVGFALGGYIMLCMSTQIVLMRNYNWAFKRYMVRNMLIHGTVIICLVIILLLEFM